jgi:TIR domain
MPNEPVAVSTESTEPTEGATTRSTDPPNWSPRLVGGERQREEEAHPKVPDPGGAPESRFRSLFGKHQEPKEPKSIPSERATSVFVSYSRRDKLAEDVATELVRQGYSVWRDTTSIPGGNDWRKSISRGIRSCDSFVLLLSPNALRHPKYIWEEIGVAQQAKKPIVGVRLKRIIELPEGFDLVLGNRQFIDLFPEFKVGIGRLVEAIGGPKAIDRSDGFRGRALRMREQARRFSHEHEVRGNVKKYGAAALAGAAAATVLLGKGMIESERQRERNDQQRQRLGIDEYIAQTSELIHAGLREFELTGNMDAEAYRDEFRPKFTRILGKLEATVPESASLAVKHEALVRRLDELLVGCDELLERAEDEDLPGYSRAVERLKSTWAEIASSSLAWLQEASEQ